jgi:hypothetical protein
MTTILDFGAWLDQADPAHHDDVYDLYSAVRGNDQQGLFRCQSSRGGTGWVVTADHVDDRLLMANPRARETFLGMVESRYCDEMPIEGWYVYCRAMERAD